MYIFGSFFCFLVISIHSLLAEGDPSRPRRRGAPCSISIHSLLAEGDLILSLILYSSSVFQSTPSSRRETRLRSCGRRRPSFQSTPSSRRETDFVAHPLFLQRISIHSLLAEGDIRRSAALKIHCYFNPLPPRGGRPSRSTRTTQTPYFNPLPPRGGRLAKATTALV